MPHNVYVNRTLNLKKIRFIGLDMDHTLVRYKSMNFERLSHAKMLEKLAQRGYPEMIRKLQFDEQFAIRGLVIDRHKGNLLKLNRYTAIRASYHGLKPLDFKMHQKIYRSTYIDLSNSDYMAVDTFFSYSLAVLYSQLVEMKDAHPEETGFPDYAKIADDALEALDEAHRDGSLKEEVKRNLDHYIIKDPSVVRGLEKFKKHGKKLFIVTNSDFHYTKLLLDYAITPYLKDHKSWLELFEYVITFAQKPRFFYEKGRFLRINPADGTMTNVEGNLGPGVYQGGNAMAFTDELKLEGDDILYIGDHIYGDILRLKKDCNWRTAMVLEELESEMDNIRKAEPLNSEIEVLMRKKEPFEDELTDLMTRKIEDGKIDEGRAEQLQKSIAEIDAQISSLIKKQQSMFNPNWGQLMRAGNEESYLAYQVDRYACVYMAKLSDLLELSPRTYFRAPRRPLAHEVEN